MKRLLICLFVLCYFEMNAQNATIVNSPEWSSMETLSIPLHIRQAEFAKGNIVPNASFEDGQVLGNASLITKFKIKGWEKVGTNVEWVNVGSRYYHADEAHVGKHAIKIVRKASDVKEINNLSEGVVSDFIKVIPGNYSFFVDIRLENIFPAVERYQVKISKDIDIHLEFYDKNKNEVSPGIYYHRFGKEVDNSFKGYAFSNFFFIDKFAWGKILARTYNNNFVEGDMPDNTEYIKIFFGLKGRGTMYIDNVDFKFSRWNFTTLERLSPFFEGECKMSQLLVPTPKQVSEESEIDLKKLGVVIVLPDNPKSSETAAMELLKKHISEIKGLSKKIMVVKNDYTSSFPRKIIFNIGETALSERHSAQLDRNPIKGKEQGYLIKRVINPDGNSIIFLTGNNAEGNYYAATTVVQLFDKIKSVYHHADIIDFPDFLGRGYRLQTFNNLWTIQNNRTLNDAQKVEALKQRGKDMDYAVESVKAFAFYKLNKIYNDYWSLSKRWWDPGKHFYELYDRIGAECSHLGMISTCIQMNPYFHFDYESEEEKLSDSIRILFSHSNPADIEKIKNILRNCIDRGAKTVMICADDFVPHAGSARGEYALFTEQDKKAYFNMANAQVSMLNEIRAWLDKKYSGIKLEFVPAPYLNEFIDYGRGSAEAFFRDLTGHLSKDISIIWTGNTVRSLVYDRADFKRYTDLIKSKPMLWDNTPYARDIAFPNYYPGKTVMCNLFEPYDITVPEDFYKLMDSDIYSNGASNGERFIIKYATYADFTWNNNAYDPDFSLFKTLIGKYGKQNALKLLQFNDHLYKLVSIHSKIKVGLEKASAQQPYTIDATDKNKAVQIEKSLGISYSSLEKTISNKRLIMELKNQMDENVKNIQNIENNSKGFLEGEYFLQR